MCQHSSHTCNFGAGDMFCPDGPHSLIRVAHRRPLVCPHMRCWLQSGTVLTFTGATFVCAGELAPDATSPGQLLPALL